MKQYPEAIICIFIEITFTLMPLRGPSVVLFFAGALLIFHISLFILLYFLCDFPLLPYCVGLGCKIIRAKRGGAGGGTRRSLANTSHQDSFDFFLFATLQYAFVARQIKTESGKKPRGARGRDRKFEGMK